MNREYWQARGELYPCPNPAHDFRIGRWIVRWQLAQDAWSTVSYSGNLLTHRLKWARVESPEGLVFTEVVVGRLMVLWARAPE
jgi:hypothetical protein